jgi:hypothetical protein
LSVDDALSLVGSQTIRAYIGRIGRSWLFLDLQKEWIARSVALEIEHVVAEADRTSADDLESHIEGVVLRKEVATFGLEGPALFDERGKHGAPLAGVH